MSAGVMHIDMDAFFASVEQQVNPSLRGKPVIVGGRNNKYRSIIVAASYEAKARGVKTAMPSWQALRLCPEAIFVPTNTARYIYASDRIFAILQHFTPNIEKFSIDEFFLDLNGIVRRTEDALALGKKIKARIKKELGITCSIGAAPSRITAKLAAKQGKPDGLVVMNKKQVLGLMKNLSVDKVCGIGRNLKSRFNHLGVETCGQLAGYPDHLLKDYFGVTGLWLKSACRAEDTSEIGGYTQEDPAKSVGHSQTLREPSCDHEYVRTWMYLLSEMVAHRLRRKKLQGRTVFFYLADGFSGGRAKRKTFQEPTYDGYEIYQRACRILESMRLTSFCARVLGVSVSGLSDADNTYLFEEQNRRDRLLRSVDKINDKYGDWTIYPARVGRT